MSRDMNSPTSICIPGGTGSIGFGGPFIRFIGVLPTQALARSRHSICVHASRERHTFRKRVIAICPHAQRAPSRGAASVTPPAFGGGW